MGMEYLTKIVTEYLKEEPIFFPRRAFLSYYVKNIQVSSGKNKTVEDLSKFEDESVWIRFLKEELNGIKENLSPLVKLYPKTPELILQSRIRWAKYFYKPLLNWKKFMNVSRTYKFKSSFIEASAGTGKTYTIMEIVIDLILEHKIPLTQILILTYTEKAAGELKERLRKKLISSGLTKEARELDQVTISTIHGFCNTILKEYPVETETHTNWILTDALERLNIALYKLQHEEWNSWVDPEKLEDFILSSKYRFKKENILISASKLLSGKKYEYSNETTTMTSETFLQKTALIIADMVLKEFKTSEWMSYDQMILKTRDSLENSRLRKALQSRYRVGILDEFQDTDGAQYEIFKRLFLESNDDRALYLIGDPKQSIYGFRGADIGIYLQAKEELKKHKAEEISLNVNYRSVPELIRAYNEIFGGKSGKQSFFPILEQSIPIQYEPVFAPKENIKVLLSDKQKQGPIQIVRFTGKDFWNTQDAKNAWGQFISEEILKLIHKEDPFTYQVAEGDSYYVEKN
ncbi:UvrD/REP helicase N-terminal domain protein [Leptospira interrogans serovar Pyrogenes str. 200701872]|uniref:UvrD/REP helicase N-terminal domain protein n=1 Tax=Leptospira interrogans serovar Pyrogenes str. 200701872 TaxID=1193029 RepID=M6ZR93_LEPIR|nr:UvrD/REP helicase N-terminal domain protein [Leptospira interrogans serovar Pyrogenes str. 200701872]